MQIVMLPQNSLLVLRNLQLCNLPILPPLHHMALSHLISYCADLSLEPLPNFDHQCPSPNLVPQFYYTFLVWETPELHTPQMPHEFIVADDTLCLVLCSLFLITTNIRSTFSIVTEYCIDVSMDP